jgi:hypothetical protein
MSNYDVKIKANRARHVPSAFQWICALWAFCLSWVTNGSVLWGILHFILGPFYIAYWYLHYTMLPLVIESLMVR